MLSINKNESSTGCRPDGFMLFYGECIRPAMEDTGIENQYNITRAAGVKMAAALKIGYEIDLLITVTTLGKASVSGCV